MEDLKKENEGLKNEIGLYKKSKKEWYKIVEYLKKEYKEGDYFPEATLRLIKEKEEKYCIEKLTTYRLIRYKRRLEKENIELKKQLGLIDVRTK